MPPTIQKILLSLLAGMVLGVPVALLSPGAFFPGWAAAALLLSLSVFALLLAWGGMGGGRKLAFLVAAAFLLRLVAGIGLSLAYQAWGFDTEVYQSGFLFPDALKRDTDAYQLARMDTRIVGNPDIQLGSDQYGGLGMMSALVYRYLSRDAHRYFLILILGSLFFALGMPFLYKAVGERFGMAAAGLAAWVYLLYPDGIFFTSSQMREPYIIGLSAVAFWAAFYWKKNGRTALLAGALSLAAMLFISTRAASFIAAVMAFLFWIEFTAERQGRAWQIIGWVGLAVGGLVIAVLTWSWFREASIFDRVLTLRNSGRLADLIKQIGERYIPPVIAVYGLFQPVLPAAIADPSIPLAKVIVILRSAGWYLLIPLLLYGLTRVWSVPDRAQRRVLVWAVLSLAAWTLVASIRGGGDMTDNPRYRVLFLVWMALVAAWAVPYALARRDPWFWRWLLVEAIFLGFFTQWYFSRYFRWGGRLSLPVMLFLIAVLSGLVILGGWTWDQVKKGKRLI